MKQIDTIKLFVYLLLFMGVIFAIFGIYFAILSIHFAGFDAGYLIVAGLMTLIFAAGCFIMCYIMARLYAKLRANLKRIEPNEPKKS